MLGMAVAAVSFAACNKEDITPSVEQGNKSVTLSLANVLQTKSASNKVAADEIKLNSFQVFFSDGTTLYSPKTVDGKGTATTRFTQQEEDGLYEFHFLPKAVNQVIVVGNMAQLDVTTNAALLAAVKDLTVGGEQNPANVRLMGIDTVLEPEEDPTHHAGKDNSTANPHPDPYVRADVNLAPAVARFEITGFEYALKTGAEKRNYTTMTVDNLSIRNYYTKAEVNFANVPTTDEADLLNFGGALTKDNVYVDYFNKLEDKPVWWLDKVGTTLDADAYASVVAIPKTETEPAKDCYAYNVFPGALPQFLMQLTGAEGGVESPLYLMTSALKVDGVALAAEDITAGNVYRMAMKFDDNNLQNPEKCIEVSITVDEWVVVAVTPEF